MPPRSAAASKRPYCAGTRDCRSSHYDAERIESAGALGEDSRRQFKQDMQSPDALAAEMVAFANSEGGVIFLGVADDASLPGLSLTDVSRLNQMISNVAAQHVRSPLTVLTENVELENGRLVADFCFSACYTYLQHSRMVYTRTQHALPRHLSLMWQG